MNNFQIDIREQGGWNNLDGWVRPFDLTFALDETLDSGSVQVTGSTRKAIIKPYTLIRLTINTTVKYMLVQDANARKAPLRGRLSTIGTSRLSRPQKCSKGYRATRCVSLIIWDTTMRTA